MEKFIFRFDNKTFEYFVDTKNYKADSLGQGGRKFKKFFIEFSKQCFKINSELALFDKTFCDFPLANSERNSYASIATAGNIIKGYHMISEYCFDIKKKTPKDEEEKADIKNNVERRFLDFFLVGENGFNVAIEVKNIWQNIATLELAEKCKKLIDKCIDQAKTHAENEIKKQFSAVLNDTLCVALIISPIFFNIKDGINSKNYEKELKKAKEKRKNAINTINNYILDESYRQLKELDKNKTIEYGLISSVFDCKTLLDEGYTHWTDGILTDIYMGALVLK